MNKTQSMSITKVNEQNNSNKKAMIGEKKWNATRNNVEQPEVHTYCNDSDHWLNLIIGWSCKDKNCVNNK